MIFDKHHIPVHFKPTNTLRQKLVHPKDKTPRHEQSNRVHAVQFCQECTDLYTGETKQPLHNRMAQHRRADSSGQDSDVHLHLEEKNHSFEENNVKQLINHSHLGPPCLKNPHEGRLDPQRTSGPNNSETQSSQVSLTSLKACSSPPVSYN